MITQKDLEVSTLGEARHVSPLASRGQISFVPDSRRLLLEDEIGPGTVGEGLSFEKSGPRERIFFDPAKTSAAIVTCGGLCPGLNNVIRSVFLELSYNYGVKRTLGIRQGYRGLNPDSGLEPIEIDEAFVHRIHDVGGTVLGSSRGPQPPEKMVDFLEQRDIDILFTVGGDGTQRGASAIRQEIGRRGLAKAVVGIPKTIDNDIPFVWMTFGYATAIEKAEEALRAAHIEALGAPNGVGLVKVMGRDSGFIAAGAALASQEANFVLVPEVPFPLEGENGLLAHLKRRIEARGHALIVVAEGAGQHLFEKIREKRDESGNVRHEDVGVFLRDRISAYMNERDVPVVLRYIDPSYLIRGVPANSWDRILCDAMARGAVHAAMAGKTDILIGFHHASTIHVPIPVGTSRRRKMELTSHLWESVLSTTGQPRW